MNSARVCITRGRSGMREDEPRYISAKEAASILGVSRVHVYALTQKGIIRSVKLPHKRMKFDCDSVESYRMTRGGGHIATREFLKASGMDDLYISVSDAAVQCKCTRQRLYQLIDEGRLPTVLIKNRHALLRKDADNLNIRNHTLSPADARQFPIADISNMPATLAERKDAAIKERRRKKLRIAWKDGEMVLKP